MLSFETTVERPQTVAEALGMLDSGGSRRLIAGGTDLIPRLAKTQGEPVSLLDLSRLGSELDYIRLEGGMLAIGALTTHDAIAQSELVGEQAPVLAQACRVVGSQQIRNRGTIGGNLANASPAGDSLPALLALDAAVRLISSRGSRSLPVEEFLTGPGRTQLARDEMIGGIDIPAASLGGRGFFTKLGVRNALAIAIASVAVVIDRENECRVAYGSLGPRPVRARELEAAIAAGKIAGRGDLEPYVSRATSPISDIRATDWYRREMAVNLTFMTLCEAGLIQGYAGNE